MFTTGTRIGSDSASISVLMMSSCIAAQVESAPVKSATERLDAAVEVTEEVDAEIDE